MEKIGNAAQGIIELACLKQGQTINQQPSEIIPAGWLLVLWKQVIVHHGKYRNDW